MHFSDLLGLILVLNAGVDEGHGAEEEVGEQHPVDDGCPQDGQDREHSGQV